MALKPDHKYHGTVREGSEIIESQSGSLGYQVMLRCEDGDTSYTIWLTNKNRDRAEKTFTEALGVSSENLQNPAYLENKLAADIAGHEVTFVTEEETYKDRTRIKVAWLFKRSAMSNKSPGKAVAGFFTKAKTGAVTPDNPIDDNDVPF
jgi:hypothetical protein